MENNLITPPGTIRLGLPLFPKLQDKYTQDELDHMLLITGMDMQNSGLKLFQTTPELSKNNLVITTKTVAGVKYPITKTAMEKEFVHAKYISMLNTAAGKDPVDYVVTSVFIGDKNNKNLKLADVFLGDSELGNWLDDEQVQLFAKSMNIGYYVR